MRPADHMRELTVQWIREAAAHRHLFRQEWLGERFFHLPGDVVALQHLCWQVRPGRIIATGIAAGGGPIFAASMLELIGGDGRVVAIDRSVTDAVRARLREHPLGRRIDAIEASTIAPESVARIADAVAGHAPVLAILDHDHTHAHVLAELRAYAPMVSIGSYVVVLDTIMEALPADHFAGKPYGKGNNPGTATAAFLAEDDRFEVDREIEDRVLMTLAPGGFLRRVR